MSSDRQCWLRPLVALACVLGLYVVAALAQTNVANSSASLAGKTLMTAEGAWTVTGLWAFSRSTSPPFSVNAGAAMVTNLDADKLHGQTDAYYRNASNLNAGVLSGVYGGTGISGVPSNGQLLIGSGTGYTLSSITAGTGISVTTAPGGITINNTSIGQVQLLKANSGTDTAAVATNVDTIAISGLTAKDQLYITFSCFTATQATGQVQLYTATDAIVLASLTAGAALVANTGTIGSVIAMTDQSAVTQIDNLVSALGSPGQGALNQVNATAVTTAWTGAWTLALRHNGVTAGGTFRYRWAVYKIVGQ